MGSSIPQKQAWRESEFLQRQNPRQRAECQEFAWEVISSCTGRASEGTGQEVANSGCLLKRIPAASGWAQRSHHGGHLGDGGEPAAELSQRRGEEAGVVMGSPRLPVEGEGSLRSSSQSEPKSVGKQSRLVEEPKEKVPSLGRAPDKPLGRGTKY